MTERLYHYVGSSENLASVSNDPAGEVIESATDLRSWLSGNAAEATSQGAITATYTIDRKSRLLLAQRRTEHVACASGGPVKSAGEISFTVDGKLLEVSNQSTGFCPEPESWPAVATALRNVVSEAPSAFTVAFTFRRCPSCKQILVIKDQWFVCDVCDADVPTHWNFQD